MTAMDPRIMDLIQLDPDDPEFPSRGWTPNPWNGADFGSVRLAAEDGPEDGMDLYVFTPDRAKVLRWKVHFDGSTPLDVIARTVQGAINDAELYAAGLVKS